MTVYLSRREATRHLAALGVRATRVALEIPDNLTFERWLQVGSIIGRTRPGVEWWLADWFRDGYWTWPRDWVERAAPRLSRRSYRTLQNLANLGDAFTRLRRRPNLSVGHQASVVSLPLEQQEALLDQAEAERWTVQCLRGAVREAKR